MRINIPFTDLGFEFNALKSNVPASDIKPVAMGREVMPMHSDSLGALMGTHYKVETFYEAYRTHSDIRAVIREFQQNVGSSGWQLSNIQDPSRPIDEYYINRVAEVLKFGKSMSSLLQWIELDKYIGGNFYGYKIKNIFDEVIGYQRIDPRTISIVRDQHNNVVKYIQKNFVTDIVVFDPEEILHIPHTVDPDFTSFGMSELQALFPEVETDLKAGKRNQMFLSNFTVPGSVYRLKEMSKEQRTEMLDFIKENFRGAENAYKPTVLSGVEGIDTFAMNNKDMEFLQGRRFATEKICSAFGTPKSILGYTEGMTYSNVEGMYKKWILNTIIPEENTIAEYLGDSILESIEDGLSDEIKFTFNHQNVEDEAHALNEFKSGSITLRQYKAKTGQNVDKSDEDNPNIDVHVIQSGTATLLEQAGESTLDNTGMIEATNGLIKEMNQL